MLYLLLISLLITLGCSEGTGDTVPVELQAVTPETPEPNQPNPTNPPPGEEPPPVVNPPPPTPVSVVSPSGIWKGNTSKGRTVYSIILADNRFWFLYSVPGNPDQSGGMVTGTLQHTSTTWTMANAFYGDIYFEDCPICTHARVQGDGTWIDNQRLGGDFDITYFTPDESFQEQGTDVINLVYDTRSATTFNRIAAAGTYQGNWRNTPLEVTLTETGTLSGRVANGCTLTGTVTVNGSAAENVITYNGISCGSTNVTMRGVLGLDSTTGKLFIISTDQTRDNALLFVGQR